MVLAAAGITGSLVHLIGWMLAALLGAGALVVLLLPDRTRERHSAAIYREPGLQVVLKDNKVTIRPRAEVEIGLCLVFSETITEATALARQRRGTMKRVVEGLAVLTKGNKAAIWFSNLDNETASYLIESEVEVTINSLGNLLRVEQLRPEQAREFQPD